jgi:crotonobetaine/carnitine-CoA ligase
VSGRNEGIARYLARHAGERPDKTFLRIRDEVHSYRDADRAVNRIANSFAAAGVGHGDKVAVMLPNCSEYLFTFFALARLGAVTVSINTGYQDTGLERMLATSQARLLVVDERHLGAVAAVAGRVAALERLIVRGERAPGTPPATLFRDFVGADETPVATVVRPGDPALLVFTSGTTGPPKAVEMSQAYVEIMAADMVEYWRFREDDVLYSPYPLYHVEAPVCTVLPALLIGATAAIGERFSASRFWDEIRFHGATWFSFLGGVLTILAKQPERPDDADNPVRFAIGAGMPHAWRDLERRWGLRLFEWYASTESGLLAFDDVGEPHRDGAAGRVTRHYEVKIVDADDNELPPGEVGEIVSRSRRPHGQMTGYFGDPEATLRAFRGLWYRSGDSGFFDAEGGIHFVGRTKEAIRRRGVNISAFEVEETLTAHPAVAECAVLGVPDDLGEEEEVKAVALVAPGAQVTPEELLELAAGRLPRGMRPRYVELVDSLPKTPTGKVLKRELLRGWRTPATYDAELGAFLDPSAAEPAQRA